jgi:hypothetical protein
MKTMILLFALLFSFSIADARLQRLPHSASSAPAHELRILFVGNSLTGFNNMPGLFEFLANKRNHKPYVESYLKFDETLAAQFADAQLRQTITADGWDYVVLQEYSDLPLRDPKQFQDNVDRFRDLIGTSQTKLLLFENWPYLNAAGDTMKRLSAVYVAVAKEASAQIVPVGEAMNVVTAVGAADVYAEGDDKHPSVMGTYIGAMTFLKLLYGIKPQSVLHTGANKNTPNIYSGPALAPSLVDLDQLYSKSAVIFVQTAVDSATQTSKSFAGDRTLGSTCGPLLSSSQTNF